VNIIVLLAGPSESEKLTIEAVDHLYYNIHEIPARMRELNDENMETMCALILLFEIFLS
jgi:hypothetical protein